MSDYLASCVDNVLISLSSARLVAANATMSVEARVGVPGVTFGDVKYLYSVFLLNTMVTLVYWVEAFRTRFWRNMPHLDMMDLTSTLMATLKGGVIFAGGTSEALHGCGAYPSGRGLAEESKTGFSFKDLCLALDRHGGDIPSIAPVSAFNTRLSREDNSSTIKLLADISQYGI